MRNLQPGDQVDGFRVVERIHSGGMGVVYRIESPDADHPLVMKVPRFARGESASSLISYETEATVLRALRGPHAPRLVASGDLETQPYLAMERIDGTVLKEWVEKAPLPAPEVARLGAAVATALHAIHQQDAIHLDVKPSNVIIRPSGEAVLIDFGLAHHAHHPDLLSEESLPPQAPRPTSRRSSCSGTGPIRGATSSRWVSCCTSSRRHACRSARRPPAARSARACTAIRSRPGQAGRRSQSGCRRSSSAASSRGRATGMRPPRRWPSTSRTRIGWRSPQRGRRTRRSGPVATFRRWIRAAGFDPVALPAPSAHLSGAPIVMIAIATSRGSTGFAALRAGLNRVVVRERGARVACVTVVKPVPALGTSIDGGNAAQLRLEHLKALRAFAEPLRLAPEQVSMHVLESNDPAEALIHYARVNRVDHVVIGAPPPDLPAISRASTVAMRVAVEVRCTVTLVRDDSGPVPDAAGGLS